MKKILVVDDDKDTLSIIESILNSESYKVFKSSSGSEALESLASFTPDLIMLDIMMPNIDGIELCKEMRKLKHLNRVPIIMVSAKLSTIDKHKSFDAGANGFITKPFSAREFVFGVNTYLKLENL